MNTKVYLKPNVLLEPLVDQWYAWAHLVSPATLAMNIVGRHLKIMQSYVKAPQVHAAAVKNPKMLGGPFIDCSTSRLGEIKKLMEETRQERKEMIDLHRSIADLNALLKNEAVGHSLEPLYDRIPPLLKGYVELVYDLNNQPSFRLIEPLLYRSRYHDTSKQSLIFSFIDGDDRPFVLSTPRLKNEGDLHLRMPFDHEGIDELFKMTRTPQTLSHARDAMGIDNGSIDNGHGERFEQMFTTEAPKPYNKYEGKRARWRYFGHACILLETATTSILSDPVLSYAYETDISRYTYQNIPDVIDYVVITHNHQDHIMIETMLQLRHKVRHVVIPKSGGGALQDPSLKLMLKSIGFDNVIELGEMEEIKTDSGSITGLPFMGEHSDLDIPSKLVYLVNVDGHKILIAADSCNIDPNVYKHVHEAVGDADALFLGMECDGAPMSWLYGPLLTKPLERKMDQGRRLAGSNYERAIDLVNRFNFKEVYVYAMGMEPWLKHIMAKTYTDDSNPIIASDRLIKECRERGRVSERLFGEKEILLDR